jgi:hypothetical protein
VSKDIDALANAIAQALDRYASKKLRQIAEDFDPGRWGAWPVAYDRVRTEYADGRLRSRVRRFANANPVLLVNPGAAANAILDQIIDDLVEEVVGSHPIPRGIEEGDVWLAPSTELQRMLLDRASEDAVAIVVAKRTEDGRLEPAFAWTESEEVIAEAQKGYRRYMTLLAREGK